MERGRAAEVQPHAGDARRARRVVVVDDSIVRGTTTPPVVALLRKAGAREVHLRICAPPMRHPCYLGVDTARRSELIAGQDERAGDPEAYRGGLPGLPEPGGACWTLWAWGSRPTTVGRCFTGNYPMPIQLDLEKLVLEEP